MTDTLNEAKLQGIGSGYLVDEHYPIVDIDIETGLYRIDVHGMLEVRHWSTLITLKTVDGETLDPDDFYNEEEE